ncbi:hypothetical protein C8R43DRAFT_1026084 [Mycena crocata]|nr:hypothetical protein C8R43DRAFT_1026084 [Mycena crocata]
MIALLTLADVLLLQSQNSEALRQACKTIGRLGLHDSAIEAVLAAELCPKLVTLLRLVSFLCRHFIQVLLLFSHSHSPVVECAFYLLSQISRGEWSRSSGNRGSTTSGQRVRATSRPEYTQES